MSHFHRHPILVPVDFSTSSLQALRTARSIAPDDSGVIATFVVPELDFVTPFGMAGTDVSPDDAKTQGQERLTAWLKEHDLDSVRTEVEVGDPGFAICEMADTLGIKLVVMPSHGRSGLKRVLLGSVAERVLRHCHCPVLLLRYSEDAAAAAQPLSDNWCPRKRVVVPIDFSESSEPAIRVALELVDGRECIDVINAVPSFDPVLIGSQVVTDEVRQANRQEELERFLAEHNLSGVRAHAIVGNPGIVVAEYAEHVKADTVLISSHGYHGMNRLLLGSTAERVLRHCHAPVLVLRRHDAE